MIRDPETLDGILDSIRRFVNEALIPREHEVAETDNIPDDVIARSGQQRGWKLRSEHPSPRYTTRWEELLRV